MSLQGVNTMCLGLGLGRHFFILYMFKKPFGQSLFLVQVNEVPILNHQNTQKYFILFYLICDPF